MSSRRHTVAVTVAAVIVLVGCAPSEPSVAPTTTPSASPATAAAPDGLAASLVQYRRDQPGRLVEVKLANAGPTTLPITLLDVTLPGFARNGRVDRAVDVRAGRRVDLPVPLGEAVCDRPPAGTASARLEIAGPDGGSVRTTLPIDDDDLLDRLHDFDCAVLRADTAATFTLEPSWRVRGSGRDLTVDGVATVTRTDADATIEITGLAGGILFIIRPETIEPAPPVQIDDGRTAATLDFELLPARCDGHAIAEAKRLTTVTFFVSVDGAEDVPIRRAPDDAGFETLLAALNERCATG